MSVCLIAPATSSRPSSPPSPNVVGVCEGAILVRPPVMQLILCSRSTTGIPPLLMVIRINTVQYVMYIGVHDHILELCTKDR